MHSVEDIDASQAKDWETESDLTSGYQQTQLGQSSDSMKQFERVSSGGNFT